MIYVVEYLDSRNEGRRTAVVSIPESDPRLIPFILKKNGRHVGKILYYHVEGKPEERVQWT